MPDLSTYEDRRNALKQQHLSDDKPASPPAYTGGVDHLALISSDLDKTIRFYTEVVGMRLTQFSNRDEPTSTHIFFDMGGGNSLAFFDFPEKDTEPRFGVWAVCTILRSRQRLSSFRPCWRS